MESIRSSAVFSPTMRQSRLDMFMPLSSFSMVVNSLG